MRLENIRQINKNYISTEHYQYFCHRSATFSKARDITDGTFDIDTNKWIKKN